MSEMTTKRLPAPAAAALRAVLGLGLAAGGLAAGVYVGRKIAGPDWVQVINYVGCACYLVLVVANPLLGFLLWVVLSPYFGFALLHIPMGRGIPDLSLSRLVLALLFMLIAAQIATGRRRMAPITLLDVMALLSAIGIGLSIWPAYAPGPSLAWFLESFLMPVITYFVARNLITDERRFIGAQRALILVGLGMALVVIQEQLMGYSWFPTVGSTYYGKHLRRVTGLLGNPAFLAVCIAMSLPFTWRALLTCSYRGRRRLLQAAIVVMYVGLFLTYNRAGWAGGAATILIFFIFYPRFRRMILKLSPLFVVLLIVFWPEIAGSYALSERLVASNPISYRLQAADLALRVFMRNPFLGIGFGNLWYLAGRYAGNTSTPLDIIATPHNTFLWVMVSAGLAGAVPYVATFLLMGWQSLRLYWVAPRIPGMQRDVIVAFWAAMAAYLAQVIAVDMLYGIYPNMLFFFIAGSTLSYQYMTLRRARRAAAPTPAALAQHAA
jgi:O-antigen ligase